MSSPEDFIEKKLREIEVEKEVLIIYACEAGSRAWGFPSKDSDYDVRYIYVRPMDWYFSLNVENRRDTLEWMSEDRIYDFVGWDLRKVLRLMHKSNPSIMEWLFSPTVYLTSWSVEALRSAARNCYSRTAAHYHYLSMANNNFRRWLVTDRVRFKKYLYVLRPLMAVNFISLFDEPVPVNYFELVDRCQVDSEVKDRVRDLIRRKADAEELDDLPRDEVLHSFITRELEAEKPQYEKPDGDNLDELFRDIVLG